MQTSYPSQEPLTAREMDILRSMVEGLNNTEIAERLTLSAGTVKWYVKQLYSKLGVHTREEAIAQALAWELVAPTVDAASGEDTRSPVINPLPQDVSTRYIGHEQKLTLLTNLIHQRVRLISIYGRAGSGKTALACKVIGDLRHTQPNTASLTGIVCLSAQGTGITFNRVFADIGRLLPEPDRTALEAIARNMELTPAQKIGLLLEKVATQRILILLDNLETVQNPADGTLIEAGLQQWIEMSLEQSSALTFVITSREPLALPRALKTWENLISLEDGLPIDDAITLLRQFDPSNATGLRDAPDGDLRELATRLNGFPRALEAVAGMLLEDPLLTLADVRRDIDTWSGELTSLVVQQALAHLNAEALCVMQCLAVYDSAVPYEAITQLTAPYLDQTQVRTTLGRLIRSCFVKVNRATQQYALHPLDQQYCYAQIPLDDAAATPFTRPLLHHAAAAYYRTQHRPRSAWQHLIDLEPHFREFRHRVSAGDDDEAARVLLTIDRDHVWEWGHHDLLRTLYEQLNGNLQDQRVVHQVARRRAWIKFFVMPDEADQEFTALFETAQQSGNLQEQADALDDMAQTFRRGMHDPHRAIDYHRQALEIYRQIGDRRGEAEALGGLGAIFTEAEPEEAIDCLLAAAEIHREMGNHNSLSFALDMLGFAYESLGEYVQAIQTLESAIEVAQQSRSLAALIRACGSLSRVLAQHGEIERASAVIEQAIQIAHQQSGQHMSMNLAFYIANTALTMTLFGHPQRGFALIQNTLFAPASQIPNLMAFAVGRMAFLLTLAGDYPAARRMVDPTMIPPRYYSQVDWAGVMLVKTGERSVAADVFEKVKMTLRHMPLYGPQIYASALAHAGLALIHHDPDLANTALELTRQGLRLRNWRMHLHRTLINKLAEESDAALLHPIRDLLAGV